MILGKLRDKNRVKENEQQVCKINVDDVLEHAISTVDKDGSIKNKIFEKITEELLDGFNFKNYDIKSLSLLVTLFKAPKNGVRDR